MSIVHLFRKMWTLQQSRDAGDKQRQSVRSCNHHRVQMESFMNDSGVRVVFKPPCEDAEQLRHSATEL